MKTHLTTTTCGSWIRENLAAKAQTRIGMFCACLLFAYGSAMAQVTIMDNFNSGIDAAWAHYAPLQTAPWNEQVSWTFPADPAGGNYHRIFGGVPNINYDPATDNNTGPARVGSFRNDATYTDFMTAVDLVNWNDVVPEVTPFVSFHVTAPGFLTTKRPLGSLWARPGCTPFDCSSIRVSAAQTSKSIRSIRTLAPEFW